MIIVKSIYCLRTLIAAGLVIAICFACNASAQSLSTSSWGSAPPNVSSVVWMPNQIGAFIDSVTSTVVPTNVADYKFADLAADGNLELLAAVDYSGRGYFNRIVIVHKTSVGFGVQEIDANSVVSLATSLVDLNGDGKQELLVPTSLTGYTSSNFPVDTWTAVYSWSQNVLVDSTSSYSSFETSLLANLKSSATNLNGSAPGSLAAIVAEAIYDKAQRVSNVDPSAGLNDATGWATSSVPEIRIVAAATLSDIGTPAARSLLGPLLTDSDPTVEIYASSAVKQAQNANALQVYIDVRPRDADNVININSSAPVTVKIKSAPGFADPSTIELASITFGETGTETSRIECRRFGDQDRDEDDKRDRNRTRIACLFSVSATGLSLGDSVGILRGRLKDGRDVKGVGAITVVSR